MKVFDLHCDTLSELRRAEMRGDGQTFAHNNGHIDLEKLEKGDYMLQCFAAFVNLADPTPGADPLVTALEEIDVFKRMMEQYSDRIAPVYRPEDIRKNAEAGKISGMLTIEEAGCCKGSLGVLRRMQLFPFDIAKIEGGKKLLGYRYVNVRLTEIFITFAPKTRTK